MASPDDPQSENIDPSLLPTPTSPCIPRPKTSGRPRANFDVHKAQILALYAAKTPWNKIEAILLAEHGIKAQGRTIMRRMKDDWGVEFRRVETDRSQTDKVKARIAALWADRDARPKDDDELQARLRAEGLTISRGAIYGLRKDMGLFRRWDERLGRVRPDEELDRRKRRRVQKYPAYTGAQLVPPPDGAERVDEESDKEASSPEQPPMEPTPEGYYPGLTLPKPRSHKKGRTKKSMSAQRSLRPAPPPRSTPPQVAQSPSLAPQRQPPRATTALSGTDRDIQIRALLDRVHLLEQHCLVHAIGLPGQGHSQSSSSAEVHGLESLAAAVDMGDWQHGSNFTYEPSASSLR